MKYSSKKTKISSPPDTNTYENKCVQMDDP